MIYQMWSKIVKYACIADDTNLSTKVNKVSDISDQLIPEFTDIKLAQAK